MNDTVDRMRTWVNQLIERAATLVDPPLAADARPIEVRGAIVDEIERRVEPLGGGRRVLPFNRLQIDVLAADDGRRAALEPVLADLLDAVRSRLREIRCEVPRGMDLRLVFLTAPGPGWNEGQQFAVGYASMRVPAAGADPDMPPTLTVTVIRGRATQPSYAFNELRICIGRSAAPIDNSGRIRENHISFVEDESDEHSQTVGRAHASIRYVPEREQYQLFDDGSRNGTRVIRRHETLDVVRRDPVGTTLRTGDEIQLGSAAIRIDILEPTKDS